jgi:hypothetical protein
MGNGQWGAGGSKGPGERKIVLFLGVWADFLPGSFLFS